MRSLPKPAQPKDPMCRALALLAFAVLIVCAPGAEAQRSTDKVPRIGYLVVSPLADPPSAERAAFLEGLKELGYVVDQNVVIEYRSAAWNRELLPDLAAELVKLKVDVIVAVPGAVEAARNATKTTPIIVPALGDPVEEGLVKSLARPGGNITGTGWLAEGLSGKRLELLKEAIPKLTRAAVLWNPANQGGPRQWQETQSAARKLRLTLQSLEVRDPNDVPKAFAAMMQNHPDALLIIASPITTAFRPIIIEFATKQRIPTMFSTKADVEAGGLISYAPSLTDSFRRAARYVDKVLKGANPGELPIEEPTKFELVINLKSAKSLKLTIPKTLLLQADQQIQ
jgi:putative tryptophan/tyrosine transport system substrate-binding protein